MNTTMNKELTFYLMRHGKTMFNVMDRVQGWSDSFLTPIGEMDVRYAGKGLKNIAFTSAYSSDSGRAMQTAQLVLKENIHSSAIPLKTDARLREFNFGTFEGDLNQVVFEAVARYQGRSLEDCYRDGITPEDLANYVASVDRKKQITTEVSWPAEDYETIQTRLTTVLQDMADQEIQNNGSNILVVSHGLSIKVMLAMILKNNDTTRNILDNAAVVTLKYKNGEFTLEQMNDVSYIEAGKRETEETLV